MKKLLLLVVFSLFLSANLTAQERAVKVNPIGLAFGIANAGYEFAVNDSQTATVAALYYNFSDISGFGVGGEYRFYFASDEALRGWHAGPSLGYFSLSDDFNNSAGLFNVGGQAGHQWIFGEHFLLDVFASGQLILGGTDSFATNVGGFTVGLGVSLGYAW